MTKDFSYAADVDDEMPPPDEEEAITGIVDSSDSDSSSKHGEGMPPTMPKILSKLKELTPVDFAKVISERDGLFEEDQYTLVSFVGFAWQSKKIFMLTRFLTTRFGNLGVIIGTNTTRF